jgi:hypothetical protein
MTPPDQTTTSFVKEFARLQLGQLRFAKSQLDIPNVTKRSHSSTSLSSPTKSYNLVSKNFSSPLSTIPMIYEKQVMLECLYTKDSIAYGTVRVHNCAYDKYVFIRLTQDDWETSSDIQAWHSMNYPRDNTDAFTFEINLSKTYDVLAERKRVLFAVCLQAMWQDFWDNNQGRNYVLDVFEK